MLEGFFCPYCQHLHENWWEVAPPTEDCFLTFCEKCGKDLIVKRLDTGDFDTEEIWNTL